MPLGDRLARYSWVASVFSGHLNVIEIFGYLHLPNLIQDGASWPLNLETISRSIPVGHSLQKGQSGLFGANHVVPCRAELGPRGEAEKPQLLDILETCTFVACTGNGS